MPIIILLLILSLIAAPLMVAVFFRAHKPRRAGIIILGSYAFLVALFLIFALQYNRSIPGRIIRQLRGEKIGAQRVNDLMEDIRTVPALAQLQPWAMEVLARFRSGQVRTNDGLGYYCLNSAVELSRREIPAFIKLQLGWTNHGTELPEIFVVLSKTPELASTNTMPESIVIVCGGGGFLTGMFRCVYGVLVGPPDYSFQPDTWVPSDRVEATKVKPGIYVFTDCEP